MSKATLGSQLILKTTDEVGVLAKVSKALANTSINIRAISALAKENMGLFKLVVDDTAKAIEAIKILGIEVREKPAVLLELENKVGTLADISDKLAEAEINITKIYASAGEAETSLIVLTTSDNAKAVEVLS